MESETVEGQLARIEQSLRDLEHRVAMLERRPPRSHAPAAAPAPPATTAALDFTLVGKSVLIVGGAYVIRALTEFHLLAALAGVLAAFAYALFWIWICDRALARGRSAAALFDAGTASLIAGALIWEATARFHQLSPPVASVMIVVVAIALFWVAHRRQKPAIALIAAIMTALTCIGVAIGTANLVGPVIVVSFLGAVSSTQHRWPVNVPLAFAVVTDCLAVPLVVMTAPWPAPVTISVLWLLPVMTMRESRWPERVEAILATLLGLGGAAVIAGKHPALAIACIAIAIAAYGVGLMRKDGVLITAGALAATIASLLAMPLTFVTMAWAAASLATAAAGRRFQWNALTLQSGFWAVAAAIAAFNSKPAVIAVAVVTAGVLALTSSPRLRTVLLAVATVEAILSVLMLLPESSAVTRSAVLAGGAVVLALLSVRIREARLIAQGLLIIGGAKLLAEDLRTGHAAAIVIALAVYGSAILIVSRRPPDPERSEGSAS